jgi:hypothetical protein
MSTPNTTRTLRDRMSKICSVLRDFDVTNNTRQFLYAMYRTRNRHCETCSPMKSLEGAVLHVRFAAPCTTPQTK